MTTTTAQGFTLYPTRPEVANGADAYRRDECKNCGHEVGYAPATTEAYDSGREFGYLIVHQGACPRF